MTDFQDLESPSTVSLDEVELKDPPKWPKVVGIISIVLGSLGLTCVACGGVGIGMTVAMRDTIAQQADGAPLPPTMQFGAAMYAQLAFGLVLSILLVFAGITTISRTPAGRLMHLIYGVGNIPVAAWGMFIQFQQMSSMEQYVRDYPDSPFAQGYSPITTIVSMVVGLVIGMAYPVFCIVWFGFIKKKPEDMTGSAGVY